LKLNKPFIKKLPFVLHVGEGVDKSAKKEITSAIRWNLWRRDLVGVHGVAMNERQAKSFKALVWCPVSNEFLIGQTAPINKLKHRTKVLFGTDATVSASWNIWEHLRIGRHTGMVSDKRLFSMLNTLPAEVWKINKRGRIKGGYDADIVVAREKDDMHGYDAFFAVNPEDILLVMHRGKIKLLDESLINQILNNDMSLEGYSRISIEASIKYVYGDVPALISEIKQCYPGAQFPIKTGDE
ncbi:MAG TPA: amidohydrolase family protein, partial [Candidatus Babeliaceae bacterium]|nr:amidohydrolase family protein [Candidatus Babeliaceae bacterium]